MWKFTSSDLLVSVQGPEFTNWKVFRVKALYLYFLVFIAATIKLESPLKSFSMIPLLWPPRSHCDLFICLLIRLPDWLNEKNSYEHFKGGVSFKHTHAHTHAHACAHTRTRCVSTLETEFCYFQCNTQMKTYECITHHCDLSNALWNQNLLFRYNFRHGFQRCWHCLEKIVKTIPRQQEYKQTR